MSTHINRRHISLMVGMIPFVVCNQQPDEEKRINNSRDKKVEYSYILVCMCNYIYKLNL